MLLLVITLILGTKNVLTLDESMCAVPRQHLNYRFIYHPLICGTNVPDADREKELTIEPTERSAEVGGRMIGGEVASFGKYPWVVLLVVSWPDQAERKCMGTIIGNDHIITAGSCLYRGGERCNYIVAYIGDSIFRKNDCVTLDNTVKCAPTNQQIPVNATHVHVDLWKLSQYDKDIAVLQMYFNITYNSFVRPACLTDKCLSPNNYTEEEFNMYGYGYDLLDDPSGSLVDLNYRQHSAVGIGVRMDDCQRRWRRFDRNVTITDTVICVDPEDQTKKPCGEDLGSPLTQELTVTVGGVQRKAHYLVGVLAFGLNCREENPVVNPPPLVYTNIGALMRWIMNNLGWIQWRGFDSSYGK